MSLRPPKPTCLLAGGWANANREPPPHGWPPIDLVLDDLRDAASSGLLELARRLSVCHGGEAARRVRKLSCGAPNNDFAGRTCGDAGRRVADDSASRRRLCLR